MTQQYIAPLEISLIRPPGREAVYLRTSLCHPGMLVVIGLGGLPHGALVGLDAENRNRLRQWLDAQDSRCASPTTASQSDE